MVFSRSLRVATLLLAFAALVASACSLIGDDDNGGGSSRVRVAQGVFAAQLDDKGLAVNPTTAFPAGTRQVNAVLLLEGASAGDKITARWYQLNVKDVPPGGAEVNSSVATIESGQLQDGKTVLRFSQAAPQGLPSDAWQLRIYAGGTLIRTMGFVVSPSVPAAAVPPPGPTAAPAFTNYTVVAGDTIQSLAQRFKPAAEDIQAYTTRLVQANNLAPNATLTPGQVIRVPR